MPLIPFHLGPALLIALSLFPTLDLVSFLASSVIVDVEPFYLMSQPVPYRHGFFYSYLGASILGVLVAVVMYSIRGISQRILGLFLIQQRSSFWMILFTSLLGVYSHVFLDSFLYRDIKPLYPLDFNLLLNAISAHSVYEFCGISFLLVFIVYAYRAVKAWRSGRSMGQISGLMKMLIIIIVILVVAAFGLGLLMSLPFFGEPKLRVNLASSPLREVSY